MATKALRNRWAIDVQWLLNRHRIALGELLNLCDIAAQLLIIA
jgi:hypothetical protein